MQTGSPSQELKERNKLIYKDYKSGKYTSVELVKKYGISTQRIYQIIRRQKEKLS